MNEWNGNEIYTEDDLAAICERSFEDSIEAVRTIIRNNPEYAQNPALITWARKYSLELVRWQKAKDAPISPPADKPAKVAKPKAAPKPKAEKPAKAPAKPAKGKAPAKAAPKAKAKAAKPKGFPAALNTLPQATDVLPDAEPTEDTVDKFFAD